MLFVGLALLGLVSCQQFLPDWQPETANWGDFAAVPYQIWSSVQPTAEQERLPVSSEKLQNDIGVDALVHHAENLQAIAYSTPERSRAFGSLGFNFSALYLYKTLEPLREYYDISWQPFETLFARYDNTSLSVGDTVYEALPMYMSPLGDAEAPIVVIPNIGCNATDFDASVRGKIVLIVSGDCEHGRQSALAGAAGAVGVMIYTDTPQGGNEELKGSLITQSRPEGPYPPTVGISQITAREILRALVSRERIGRITVQGLLEKRVTMNLFAQTKAGDPNNVLMLGAHVDSVTKGPGIQDNGSGVSSLLEVALQLSKYNVTNAVRFAWWSAHEFDLAGTQYYMKQSSPQELDKIRLYLNFDMLASPNFKFGVLDSDASSDPSGTQGPAVLFTKYFDDIGRGSVPVGFSSYISDYKPFLDHGIPSTGLFTGADGLKTQGEARKFGGQAGEAYDPNYQKVNDTVDNLNKEAFLVNTKATAHAVATYAMSFDSLGTNKLRRRSSLAPL